MKRMFLFLATNLAIIVVISITTSIFGFDRFITANGLNLEALLGFSLVVGFTGSFISLWISKWMAKQTYGIYIIESPKNSGESWLLETVRSQAHKAGVSMPEVGIYDSPEVNAFATGSSKNNALVAVSTGLMSQMSHRQIEGVRAHEVSHIANGDMVTMALIQGVLNTFVVFISKVAGFLVDQALRRDNEENNGVGMGYFITSIVCEIFLGILASMIVMAFSRRREFAADADAARIWGKESIIDALTQLNTIMDRGGVMDDRAKAISSFKISGAKKGGLLSLFASHPPLEDRIEALKKLP